LSRLNWSFFLGDRSVQAYQDFEGPYMTFGAWLETASFIVNDGERVELTAII
jgi:hypothetical protein